MKRSVPLLKTVVPAISQIPSSVSFTGLNHNSRNNNDILVNSNNNYNNNSHHNDGYHSEPDYPVISSPSWTPQHEIVNANSIFISLELISLSLIVGDINDVGGVIAQVDNVVHAAFPYVIYFLI